ncbi:MAG: FAA hydrolase family protein [Castellaniella sp.]|uniref:fumarylacetoacetate hydrolase family protein n=1 Tax=Castellaniella sp. TaxID=1955812 RepID=UPI0011FDC3F9|nr:fumarylacetoacetate hydrolase family protein [Castellaniella sp.]TAN27119.1 MAG: FAA hydrolase family protein [Castellaniella sp.]
MPYVFDPAPHTAVPVAGEDRQFPVHRIYCVGRNYAAHAREMGFDPEREPPFFFCKPADAACFPANGKSLILPYPSETSNFHHEVELVAALGLGGTHIAVEDALRHIWGYAIGLDMTRRDLQMGARKMGRPWEIGKAFDQSAVLGPIHPSSALPATPAQVDILLKVNGEVRQHSQLDKLIWSIAETIAHLSRYFELQPGDLLYTGTPEGVAAVVPGDHLEASISGLGTLSVDISGS